MAGISTFRGLNNVSDPLRLGLGWLAQADNVNVTDTGAIKKRNGYSLSQSGTFTGAYATIDFQRLYVVDAGTLRTYEGAVLATGLSSAPMYWTEINDQVFYNNGVDRGIIRADNTVIPWEWAVPGTPTLASVTGSLAAGTYQACFVFTLPDGRLTGSGEVALIELAAGSALQITSIPQIAGTTTNVFIAPANSTVFQHAGSPRGSAMVWNANPDALGVDITTMFLNPLPDGTDVIQAWRGRIYAAQYFPNENQSVVWCSTPLGFHLFDLDADFFMVPGRVTMLAPTEDALIVGTNERVHAYDEKSFVTLAPYGVIAGHNWAVDDDRTIVFWTQRGACRALPFSNLTEKQVSVAPGTSAGGTIVRSGGQKRYVVALQQGGLAFNSHL